MISNQIVITNVGDNDTINYPVLLIKGKIIHHYCESRNEKVEIALNENEIMNYRFKNEQFKILLELEMGTNNFSIKYCCISKNLKINFLDRDSIHKVIPLYIIAKNHNGKFQAPENIDNRTESAFNRIQTAAKLLQCIIAEKLREDGFGRKTFQIQGNTQIFHSNLNVNEVSKMSQKELWTYLGREVMNSKIGNANNKYLGFLSCTKYTGDKNLTRYEDMVKMTEGYVALGGGGLALFGTACMYTWPETLFDVFSSFEDSTIVDSDNFLNDSCYRNTFGACFSTTLGSVLHELCHTFDLGHTKQGVMGRGFDNIDKFYIDLSEEMATFEKSHCGRLLPKSTNGFVRKSNSFKAVELQYKPIGETYFTRSCSALLYHHRFFNNYSKCPENFILAVDRKTKLVRSTIGIRVIEARESVTELVLNSWIFSGKILKYSFQIPDDIVNSIIVIEDNIGNLLKDENSSYS